MPHDLDPLAPVQAPHVRQRSRGPAQSHPERFPRGRAEVELTHLPSSTGLVRTVALHRRPGLQFEDAHLPVAQALVQADRGACPFPRDSSSRARGAVDMRAGGRQEDGVNALCQGRQELQPGGLLPPQRRGGIAQSGPATPASAAPLASAIANAAVSTLSPWRTAISSRGQSPAQAKPDPHP